jgi:CubicO group peptidase (beta-lactamase class C family)
MANDLMQGFPPTPGTQVSLSNWRKAPFSKWAFAHVRELIATADIANDPDAVGPMRTAPIDLASFRIDTKQGPIDLAGFLDATDTDGFVVLHKGAVAYEFYGEGMGVATPHILMSISKSVLGLVFGILQARGVLDETQMVSDLLPEVGKTAYAGARLRDLLDMRVGVAFVEDYAATEGPIFEYRKAQNWEPLAPGDQPSDLRSFYGKLTARDGAHGGPHHYVSPNTDLLGWAIERASGRRYADLVSELLWRPLGASRSAYITVDRLGAPRCAGGMCCTTRDLARLGRLFVTDAAVDDRQVVPGAWLADILGHSDRATWDAGDLAPYFSGRPIHYRSKWYGLDDGHRTVFGVGVYGQNVFVDPRRDVVIAKFSSQPEAMNASIIDLTMRAAKEICHSFEAV